MGSAMAFGSPPGPSDMTRSGHLATAGPCRSLHRAETTTRENHLEMNKRTIITTLLVALTVFLALGLTGPKYELSCSRGGRIEHHEGQSYCMRGNDESPAVSRIALYKRAWYAIVGRNNTRG
jgi:hypothetical protein